MAELPKMQDIKYGDVSGSLISCPLCGSAVWDMRAHDAWHQMLFTTIATIGNYVLDATPGD